MIFVIIFVVWLVGVFVSIPLCLLMDLDISLALLWPILLVMSIVTLLVALPFLILDVIQTIKYKTYSWYINKDIYDD